MTQDTHGGRPRKPEGDKLVPLTTNIAQTVYDALCRMADRRGVPVAQVAREVLHMKNSPEVPTSVS